MQEINQMADALLIAKLEDKIKLCKTRNVIVNTGFLNLHEKQCAHKILIQEKFQNYLFFGGYEGAEREILFLYPEKVTVPEAAAAIGVPFGAAISNPV